MRIRYGIQIAFLMLILLSLDGIYAREQQRVVVDLNNLSIEERHDYLSDIVSQGGEVVYFMDEIGFAVIIQPAMRARSLQAQVQLPIEIDEIAYALNYGSNDPLYHDQWALKMTNASLAWGHVPSDTPIIRVAVIDSGVCLNHPDLSGRILTGWDYVDNDDIPEDLFNHGCGIAGIIAANRNNGIGIAGVAPNAQILPYRVLNNVGQGRYSDIAQAILQAVDDGANIINLSLGGAQPSSLLEQAVNYAVEQGVIVVAATGNTGQEGVLYPAAYPSVFAIGSVTITRERSFTSTYGSQLNAYAPGDNVVMTAHTGGYYYDSGTSFASAYASGLIALSMAWDTLPITNANRMIQFDLNILTCPADVNADGMVTEEDVSSVYNSILLQGRSTSISDIQYIFGIRCS
jgi:hypothetical protein